MLARSLLAPAAVLAPLVALGACSSNDSSTPWDGGTSSSSSGSSSGHAGGSSSGTSAGSSSGGSTSSSGASGSSSGTSGSSSGSSSGGTSSGGTEGGTPGSDAGGSGLFAGCSLTGGCIADCAYANPADDPLASADPGQYDIYDACIVAGLEAAGFPSSSIPFMGGLLKGEALEEGGSITPVVTTSTGQCGGQNCGMYAMSAGSVSGDSAPGPCGSSKSDPFTGNVDMSHSYGLFQDTPACEGTFLLASLPSGYTCTGTGNDGYGGSATLPFSTSDKTFYCESATGNGVPNLTGQNVKGVIDAVTDTTDPYYKLSIFNPAYNLFVHLSYSLPAEYKQANQGVPSSCSAEEMFYKTIAYWLNGDASSSCSVPGGGGQGGNLQYIQSCISNYKTIYGKSWPYPQPQ